MEETIETPQEPKKYRCTLSSNFIYPDGIYLTYKGENLFYREEVDESFSRFVIQNRVSQVKNPRNSTVDEQIIQLGNCLFPISFLVDNNGNVQQIENFDEILARRVAKSKELATQYPTIEFKKYLEISMMNFQDEPTLRSKLKYDVFLQTILPLLYRKKEFMIQIDNFPKKMKRTSFMLTDEGNEADSENVSYKVSSVFPSMNGEEEYGEAESFEKEGSFYGFKGLFTSIDKEGMRTQRSLILQMEE